MDRPWSLDVGGGVCRAGDLGFGSWAGSGTIESGSENGQGFSPRPILLGEAEIRFPVLSLVLVSVQCWPQKGVGKCSLVFCFLG